MMMHMHEWDEGLEQDKLMTLYDVLCHLPLSSLVELQWKAYRKITEHNSAWFEYTDAHELHATVAGHIKGRFTDEME